MGGEASLHLSGIACWAKREAKDKVQVNTLPPSTTPNKAIKGFGSDLIKSNRIESDLFNTWESVWKTSLQYLLRLEQDQYIWIWREASADVFGLISQYQEDSFTFEIWALWTTLNWIKQWRAHREAEFISLSTEARVSSDKERPPSVLF